MPKRLRAKVVNQNKKLFSPTKLKTLFNKFIDTMQSISFISVITQVTFIALFYIGLHYLSKEWFIAPFFMNDNFVDGLLYKNLPEIISQIEIGLFGIFFSMSVLIAGYIYESKSEETSRVLLQRSNLLSIFILNIVIVFSFIFNEVYFDSYLQLFPLSINLIVTTFSFYRTIKIITSKKEYLRALLQIVDRKFEVLHNELVVERLSQNFDYSVLGTKKVALSFSPWSLDGIEIKGKKEGRVCDISLDQLSHAVMEIDNVVTMESKVKILSEPSVSREDNKQLELIQVFLHKTIGDRIVRDSAVASIRLPENSKIQNEALSDIQEHLLNSIVLKKSNTAHEQFKETFDGYRDTFIKAINNNDIQLVDTMIAIFDKIINRFISIIRYSPSESRLERTSFRGGWESITGIERLIREGVEETIKIEKEQMLESLLFFPARTMIEAMQANDHYLFEEYATFSRFFLHLYNKYSDSRCAEIILGRTISYTKELSNIYIAVRVKNNTNANNVDSIAYAFSLLKNIQDSIKDGIDLRLAEEVQLRLIDCLLSSFDSTYYSVSEYDEALFYFMRDEEYQRILGVDEKAEYFSRISIAKYEIAFALIANLIKKTGNLNDKRISRLLNGFPRKAEYVTYIFQKSCEYSEQELWGWHWWDMDNSGKVEFREVNFNYEQTYLVLLLFHVSDWTKGGLVYVVDSTVYFGLTNKESNLRREIEKVEDSKEILNEKIEVSRLQEAKAFIEVKKNEYEIERKKYIIDSKMDKNKVDEFYQSITSGYFEELGLRGLYALEGKEEKKDSFDAKPIFGIINQLLKKEFFIKKDGTHLMGVGDFGASLRRFENSQILSMWLQTTSIETICIDDIRKIVAENSDDFILISTSRQWLNLRTSLGEKLIEEWRIKNRKKHETNRSFLGRFQDIFELSIYRISIDPITLETEGLFLLDMRTIGKCFYTDTTFKEIDKRIKLSDLNTDDVSRNRIIQENPKWLSEESEPERYLRGMSLFTISTEFQIVCQAISLRKITLIS